jgi:putative cofactor-binding repeat protein
VAAGGAGFPEPYNVKILSNKFLLRPLSKMAHYSGISGVTITGNTVRNIP